jgi:hypothetical protein
VPFTNEETNHTKRRKKERSRESARLPGMHIRAQMNHARFGCIEIDGNVTGAEEEHGRRRHFRRFLVSIQETMRKRATQWFSWWSRSSEGVAMVTAQARFRRRRSVEENPPCLSAFVEKGESKESEIGTTLHAWKDKKGTRGSHATRGKVAMRGV